MCIYICVQIDRKMDRHVLGVLSMGILGMFVGKLRLGAKGTAASAWHDHHAAKPSMYPEQVLATSSKIKP